MKNCWWTPHCCENLNVLLAKRRLGTILKYSWVLIKYVAIAILPPLSNGVPREFRKTIACYIKYVAIVILPPISNGVPGESRNALKVYINWGVMETENSIQSAHNFRIIQYAIFRWIILQQLDYAVSR